MLTLINWLSGDGIKFILCRCSVITLNVHSSLHSSDGIIFNIYRSVLNLSVLRNWQFSLGIKLGIYR